MKKKLQLLILLLINLSGTSFAKTSGVYMSLTDYEHNKLTYESDCSKNSKVHIHDFFWNMPKISVVYNGKKYSHKKSDLYGFKDCNDNVYRFYNNTEYRIAEAGNIYVYVLQKNIAQAKSYNVVNTYYFSATPDSKILPLTFSNLRNAYRGNEKFVDLIDQFFSSGDVAAYDGTHKMYKVNYVFLKTR